MISRTKSSLLNFVCAMIGQGLGVVVSLIARIFFVRILGSEYLGLDGLFTNILTILSLAELGVGTAITYSLYQPLAEKNQIKCKMLMQLYKKIYSIIGFFILIVGILITPALPLLINDLPTIDNINLIYILFVINTAISYFFSYKRNLVIADQNRYIATIYRYSFYLLLNIFQITFLVVTKNYIVFLVLQIISTLLENIMISLKADKMYPYLKDKDKISLDTGTKNDILKNTKAMLLHKVGGVVLNATDNILLSRFVNLVAVGLYSNYYLIINALNLIFNQFFSSVLASVGNLCVNSGIEKQYDIFKKIRFLGFWIYCFSSVCLITLFNPFIELWVGKQYLFSMDIVIVLVINFYLNGMRKAVLTFKEAKGLFYEDRYKPIIESLINLGVSTILVIKLGTVGVFLGTLTSFLITNVWVEPYVLYKYGFEKELSLYFRDYVKKGLLTIVLNLIVYSVCTFIHGNIYIVFLIKLIMCLILPNIALYIIYRKTEEFNYFYDKLFSKVINKVFNKEGIR